MSTPKANGGNVQPWAPRHRARGEAQSGFDISSHDRGAFIAAGVCYGLLLAVISSCWAIIHFCS